jgi:hypothetical protein
MTNTRISDIQHALTLARQHLARAEAELDRWEEPAGGDHRGTLQRLQSDVARAANDVMVLASVLRVAQYSEEAFAD